jgi:hypothetical protein
MTPKARKIESLIKNVTIKRDKATPIALLSKKPIR